MRSRTRSQRNPQVIDDILRARSRKLGYASVNAYVLGLIRYDMLTQRDHTTTVEISKQPQEEQDKIDDEIVKMFNSGETLKGSWFEANLRDAVKDVSDGKDISKDRVVAALLKKIKNHNHA